GGSEHLPQDDFGDLLGFEMGPGKQRPDHCGAELGRGGLGERAAKLADCGAQSSSDDDIGHGDSPSRIEVWARPMTVALNAERWVDVSACQRRRKITCFRPFSRYDTCSRT